MNATASMLEAPLEKTAFGPDLGEAIMQTYKQLGSKGLTALIPGVDSYAASGIAGVGASELVRRLMPQIAKKNPRKVKTLQALASGLAGGGSGLAGSFIGAPLVKDLKKVPTSKLLPELASLGAMAGGAELLAAPYLGKTTGVLEPILTTGAGAGLVSAGQGIRKKINIDNFIRAAKRAGREVDVNPTSYTQSIVDSFKKLPGGSLPAGAGAALLSTGSPILGGAALLSAPLMNNKVTEYLANVSKELQRNKEIKELYKKSSLNAPLATELSKLAAPAYLTLSPNSLEAYTMDKQAFLGAMGEFLGKGIQKFTGRIGHGVTAGRNIQKGLSSISKDLPGLQTFGKEQILRGMGHTPTTPATRRGPGFLQEFMQGLSRGRNTQFERQTGLKNITRQQRKFLSGGKGPTGRARDAFTQTSQLRTSPEFAQAQRGAEAQRDLATSIRPTADLTDDAVRQRYTATSTGDLVAPYHPKSVGSPHMQLQRRYNTAFKDAETQVNNLQAEIQSATTPETRQFLENRLRAAQENLQTVKTQHEEAIGRVYQSHPSNLPTTLPTVDTAATQTTKNINTKFQRQLDGVNAEIASVEQGIAQSSNPLFEQISRQRLNNLTNQRNQLTEQISQFAPEAASRARNPNLFNTAPSYTRAPVRGATFGELQTQAQGVSNRLNEFTKEVSRINNATSLTRQQKDIAISRLQPEIDRLTTLQSESLGGLYRNQFGAGIPRASTVTESAQAQKFRGQLEQGIKDINTQLRASPTPAQQEALTKRLEQLTTRRDQMADRVIATADTTALNASKTRLNKQIQRQEAIINNTGPGGSTRKQINDAMADKARLEGELGKVTNREQQLASEAEAATLQAQQQIAEQSRGRASDLYRQRRAPGLADSRKAVDTAKRELGGTGAAADFRVKGLNNRTGNYIYEQGLVPKEYAKFEQGTLSGSLFSSGAERAAKNSGLNEAVVNADRALGEHLSSLERVVGKDNPMVGVLQNNPDLKKELYVRANNFIRNPKMTPQQLEGQLTSTMGIPSNQARQFVEGLTNSSTINAARRDLEASSNLFSREVNNFMAKEFRANSNKVLKDIGKKFKKVKGLSAQETSQFEGVVSRLEESGLSATSNGNAVLTYLKDNSGNADSIRQALSNMDRLLNGETIRAATKGSRKIIEGGRGIGRIGDLKFSPTEIDKLLQKGLEIGKTTRGDLSQFSAKNLRNLETHFGDKAVARELQQLSVSSNQGASAVNKVMSGNASAADFTAKELSALGQQPLRLSNPNILSNRAKNGTTQEMLSDVTSQINKNQNAIDDFANNFPANRPTGKGRKIKAQQRKWDAAQKRANEAQARMGDLTAAQTEIQNYVASSNSRIDRFTNEVRNARVQYEAQGGVEGTLKFTGDASEIFQQQPGFFSRLSGGVDNLVRGPQYMTGPSPLPPIYPAGLAGAGVIGASAYGARQPQSTFMQATASFGTSPLAPPVRYIKKTAMMPPIKFKGNTVPKMLGAPVVESPITSTHIHKYLQAPVG